ncbi:MAG: hypothetical protein RLZZ142_414, partial [Verrucomicrobiota bacterium]
LILREYLEVESELGGGLRIRAKVGHPEARHLHPVEKRVFDFCAGGVAWPGSPRALNPALHASDCAPLEAVLVQMQALRPLEQSRREAKALLLPSWCLFWVGPYKMGVALMKGHTNVIFLVLLCMVGSAALKSLSNSWRRPRFGDRMLGEMRTTFRSFLNRLEALLAEGSPLIPTLVALYGRSILRISEHPSLRNLAFQGQFRSGFVSGDGGGGCGSVGGGGGDSGCGGGSGCGGCGGGD